MDKINPTKALYIKLGRGGEYERECLASPGKVHVGWGDIDHALCVMGDWKAVRERNLGIYKGKQTATNQANQLRLFYESGEEVLWITFYQGHLYWCFATTEIIPLPDGSRIRPTLQGWNNFDIKGKHLDTSRLSGSLLAMQGFRGTISKVREFDYLVRKINCESSPAEQKAVEARETLIHSLVAIIQDLHWKEFELLTDLIFRQAGWQRLGVLGKTQKDIDLDLLSPIDQERYKVQVKSAAGNREFQSFLSLAADAQGFTRYYFVVHQPSRGLLREVENIKGEDKQLVKVWLPEDIARLVVNYGLADWLIAKAK
jgi:hypothetical protein